MRDIPIRFRPAQSVKFPCRCQFQLQQGIIEPQIIKIVYDLLEKWRLNDATRLCLKHLKGIGCLDILKSCREDPRLD